MLEEHSICCVHTPWKMTERSGLSLKTGRKWWHRGAACLSRYSDLPTLHSTMHCKHRHVNIVITALLWFLVINWTTFNCIQSSPVCSTHPEPDKSFVLVKFLCHCELKKSWAAASWLNLKEESSTPRQSKEKVAVLVSCNWQHDDLYDVQLIYQKHFTIWQSSLAQISKCLFYERRPEILLIWATSPGKGCSSHVTTSPP